MNLEAALALARRGELYPAVILHGGEAPARQAAALRFGQTLLCAADPAARPCGACRHCLRIAWPGAPGERFHPDFQILQRDLRTATSVEATRSLLQGAQLSPFEARGQVFVVASAETLTGEAANALLKILEEPPARAPRHFLLLAASRLDLLPTLRSRALAIYLGPGAAVDREEMEALAGRFAACVEEWAREGSALQLVLAAGELAAAGGWEDPRATRPWVLAAGAVLRSAEGAPAGLRRDLLALAEALLAAGEWRLRGIPAERLLEGLVARHLAPDLLDHRGRS
jgi:hypothetical protein